jgi:hypothetical protein
MKRRGPWTQQVLGRLRTEIQGYFRVYYRELGNEVARYEEAAVVPHWLKGGRRIQVSGCADGLMIGHVYYEDIAPLDAASREDNEFHFYLPYTDLVKDIVARYIPPRPGAVVEIGPAELGFPDYEPGQPFGTWSAISPAQITHALPEGHDLVEEVMWSRLDVADLHNLDHWSDRSKAAGEARLAVQAALNGPIH